MSSIEQPDLAEILSEDLQPGQVARVAKIAAETRLPELVRVVERIPVERAAVMFRLLVKDRAVEVFDTLDPGHQAELIEALHGSTVRDFFDAMAPDDRVDLLDEVPASVAERLLRGLNREERAMTGIILGYPQDSVGRAMSPEVVPIYPEMTAGEALDKLRQRMDSLEHLYLLPIVDRSRHLVGTVKFRDLFTAEANTMVSELMNDHPEFAHAEDDEEETARWFLPLEMSALPIVDTENRLVGIFTWDDAREVVEYEDTEDAARSGGHEPLHQPYLAASLMNVVQSRVVWLTLLALSAVFTVKVLDLFSAELQQIVTLTLFIPLLTGTSGNTGNQAATTVTRALALGDVEKSDVGRVLWREMRVGFLLGCLLGALGFGITALIYGPQFGAVIGVTLVAVCTLAASIGGIMPLLAKAIGADPAVFSNPFISTFSDATSLILYFFIAKAILGI